MWLKNGMYPELPFIVIWKNSERKECWPKIHQQKLNQVIDLYNPQELSIKEMQKKASNRS